MKPAAVKALRDLAREPVLTELLTLYGVTELVFGRDYIIPATGPSFAGLGCTKSRSSSISEWRSENRVASVISR